MPPRSKAGKGKKDKSASKSAGNDIKSKLKNLGKKWKEDLDNPLDDFSNWEDGDYQVTLDTLEVCESKKGRLQVKYVFSDNDNEQDSDHYKFDGLDTDVSPDCMRYLQKSIRTLGFEPPTNLNNIMELCEKITKEQVQCVIRLQTKGEFQNTYIQNVIED